MSNKNEYERVYVTWKDLATNPEKYKGKELGTIYVDGIVRDKLYVYTDHDFAPYYFDFNFSEMDAFLVMALAIYGDGIKLTDKQREYVIKRLQSEYGSFFIEVKKSDDSLTS